MKISKRFFPEILQENDMIYLDYLEGVLCSVDEYATLEITKGLNAYQFRLVPSAPRYTKILLQSILELHNLFNIRLDLSKSIKITGAIVFKIEFHTLN